MNIIKIETRGAAQPRARVFIYVMHDCRRHEFVIIFTFYNRRSIQIQPLKLLVICYIGENNLACKFRKKSTLLLCSTVVGPYFLYTCIYYRHLINTSNHTKQWGKSVVFCSTWVWLLLTKTTIVHIFSQKP